MFPPQIAVSVASARDGEFDPERWWEKRKSTKLFTHEVFGMIDAIWELRGKPGGAGAATLLWETRFIGKHET
jgi:hypothetical protein